MGEMESSIRAFVAGDQVHAIIMAIVIIAITAAVSHLATKLIRSLWQNRRVNLPSGTIFVNIARATIWVIGICLVGSSCFGINVSGVVAALGVGGIAVSLGLKDTISNLIGGIQISLMGIVQPGDNVKVGTAAGTVEDISWRQTLVRDENGSLFIVPNAVINASTVQKSAPASFVAVPIVIAGAGRDLDRTASAIEQAVKAAVEPVAHLTVNPTLLLDEIVEGGAHAKLRFQIDRADRVREARDAALRAAAPFACGAADEAAQSGD